MTTFKSLSGTMQEDSCAARAGDLTMTLGNKKKKEYVQIRIAINLDGWAVERVFTKESKDIVWINEAASAASTFVSPRTLYKESKQTSYMDRVPRSCRP